MNLDKFLEECGWEIYDYKNGDFGILLETSTHDIDFKLFKNGTVRYEAYNTPADESIILSKEGQDKIISFLKEQLDNLHLRKDNLNT